MLPGIHVFPALGAFVELEFLSHQTSETNTSSYTFSAVGLGAAHSSRIVAVGLAWNVTTGIDSVTIAGISATIHATQEVGSGHFAAIASAAVPSGTSGDIVVTLSSQCERIGVGVWRLIGMSGNTPNDTAVDSNGTGGNVSSSINIPANGFAIGAYFGDGTSDETWTSATEEYGATVESSIRSSGAHRDVVSAETGTSISVSASATRAALVLASWGP